MHYNRSLYEEDLGYECSARVSTEIDNLRSRLDAWNSSHGNLCETAFGLDDYVDGNGLYAHESIESNCCGGTVNEEDHCIESESQRIYDTITGSCEYSHQFKNDCASHMTAWILFEAGVIELKRAMNDCGITQDELLSECTTALEDWKFSVNDSETYFKVEYNTEVEECTQIGRDIRSKIDDIERLIYEELDCDFIVSGGGNGGIAFTSQDGA